jgi:hypothetical protein
VVVGAGAIEEGAIRAIDAIGAAGSPREQGASARETVTGDPLSRAERQRLARLELFVERVVDVAETLEIIAEKWGDPRGTALRKYARQLGKMAGNLRDERSTD